jgi:hypothetical protein
MQQLEAVGLMAATGVFRQNKNCGVLKGLVFCSHLNDFNGSIHYDDAERWCLCGVCVMCCVCICDRHDAERKLCVGRNCELVCVCVCMQLYAHYVCEARA